MDNFQLALMAAQIAENLVPAAVGLVDALKSAFNGNTTVEALLTDALSKAQQVKDLSDQELKK